MTIGKGVFGAEIFGRASLSSSLQSVTADVSCNYLINTLALQSLTSEYSLLSSFAVVSDFDLTYSVNNFDAKICIMGDSNASSRGSFSQTTTSGATLYNVEGNLVPLADPWDAGTSLYSALHDGTSAGGSYVMHLADLFAAAGLETLWVPTNKGGTKASDWTYSTSTTTCYGAMLATLNAIGGVDALIIHLGANDAIGGISESAFTATMNGILNQLRVDFPNTAIYLQKVHHNSSASIANVDAIRSAVDTLWSTNSNVLKGADLEGITNSVHYGQTGVPASCTSELNAVAERTYAALREVPKDISVSYSLNTSLTADLTNSYGLRSTVSSDVSLTYSIAGAVAATLSPEYIVQNSISKDLTALFITNTVVSGDIDSAYQILNSVTADCGAVFNINSLTQNDLAANYTILLAGVVSSSLTTAYAISSIVSSDITLNYSIQSTTYEELSCLFKVLQKVEVSLTPDYTIVASAHNEYAVSYSVLGIQPQFTLEDLVAAVRVAIEGAPVNVTQVNGVTLTGNGTSVSPWGPS